MLLLPLPLCIFLWFFIRSLSLTPYTDKSQCERSFFSIRFIPARPFVIFASFSTIAKSSAIVFHRKITYCVYICVCVCGDTMNRGRDGCWCSFNVPFGWNKILQVWAKRKHICTQLNSAHSLYWEAETMRDNWLQCWRKHAQIQECALILPKIGVATLSASWSFELFNDHTGIFVCARGVFSRCSISLDQRMQTNLSCYDSSWI